MNKKVSIELAIGIIIILSLSFGFLIYTGDRVGYKEESKNSAISQLEVNEISQVETTNEPAGIIETSDDTILKYTNANFDVSSLPEYIRKKSIAFALDGEIYFMRSVSEVAEKIGEGEEPLISPDGKKIAFLHNNPTTDCAGQGISDDLDESDDANNSDYYRICIFNSDNKSMSTIYTDDPVMRRIVSWSPDGKYLIVNSGTYVVGAISIYDLDKKRKKGSFEGGRYVEWISEEEFVYDGYLEIDGYDKSIIKKVSIESLKEKTLVGLDGDLSASIIPKRRILSSEKISVLYYNRWSSSGVQSYWIYDTTSGKLTKTDELKEIESKIQEKLPQDISNQYSVEYQAWFYPENPNWVLFSLSNKNQPSYSEKGEIFIMDLDKPKQSLVKIADGLDVSW